MNSFPLPSTGPPQWESSFIDFCTIVTAAIRMAQIHWRNKYGEMYSEYREELKEFRENQLKEGRRHLSD